MAMPIEIVRYNVDKQSNHIFPHPPGFLISPLSRLAQW
jgi:hypothetical protein